jgi:hypothetical protein
LWLLLLTFADCCWLLLTAADCFFFCCCCVVVVVVAVGQHKEEYKRDFLAMAGNGGKSFELDLKDEQAADQLCEAIACRVLHAYGGGGEKGDQLVSEFTKRFGEHGYT